MAPWVDSRGLHLRLAHSPGVRAVRLDCDLALPGPHSFVRDATGDWRLTLPVPSVHRLEYRFELVRRRHVEHVLDPENPCLVAGVFGTRSVVRLPTYVPPDWAVGPVGGRYEPMTVAGSTTDPVPLTVWSPDHLPPAEPAGLLLVHDGPEYDQFASLARFAAHGMSTGLLPPLRLALLHPLHRQDWYSGSPAYLETLTGPVLDRLHDRYAVASPAAVMGASLGGLSALLAGLGDTLGPHPGRIGAVFAQSGSFFARSTDAQEGRFRYFDRVTAQVEAIKAMEEAQGDRRLVIGMTCGKLEENAANNRSMAGSLGRLGHAVTYREVRDLHTYTGWRDSLAPTLTEVLTAVWPQGRRKTSPGVLPTTRVSPCTSRDA